MHLLQAQQRTPRHEIHSETFDEFTHIACPKMPWLWFGKLEIDDAVIYAGTGTDKRRSVAKRIKEILNN